MDLLDIAIQGTEEEFRAYALDWLERHIGSDGTAWCNGKSNASGGIAIAQHFLRGRPEGLIADYPKIACAGPVSRRFADSPHLPQNVSSDRFYCEPEQKNILDYLEHYRVRHFFLVGVRQPEPMGLEWITLFREDRHRPFDASSDRMIGSAISMVLSIAQFQNAGKACLQTQAAVAMRQKKCAAATPVGHLTGRQHQILDCLTHGWSNKMIARNLAISENTVKTHLASLYRALNVSSRSQAIISVKGWTRDDNC